MNSQFTKRRMMKTRRATLVCSEVALTPPPPLRSALLKEVRNRSLRLCRFWMSVHQATTKSAKRGALGKRDPDVLHHVNDAAPQPLAQPKKRIQAKGWFVTLPQCTLSRSTIWQLFTRGIRSTSGLSQRRSTRMAVPTFTRSSRP